MVFIIIVVCIESYDAFQNYMDEELTYRLICSNQKDEEHFNVTNARRYFSDPLAKVDYLYAFKIKNRNGYNRYTIEITEGESGYFTYQEDITHRFKNTDYINEQVCKSRIITAGNISDPQTCTIQADDNDKITTLTFQETKEDMYLLYQREYLRKEYLKNDSQTEKETEYSCIFNTK